MQLNGLKTDKGKNIALCAVLFLLIYLCRDSMYCGILGLLPSLLLQGILFGVLLLGFLFRHRRDLGKQILHPNMGIWLLWAVLVAVPMVLKRDWQLMYINVLFAITVSVLFAYLTDLKRAARCYLGVLSVLAVYSIVCTYGLRQLVTNGVLSVPVYSPNDSFLNFGLCMGHLGYLRNRNMGLFREPGVYQYFLLLGLYLNSYQAKWKNLWIYWGINLILGVTMLTTFATGGVICTVLLAAFIYFDKGWYKTKIGIASGIGGVLALAAVYIIADRMDNDISANLYMMFYKLFSDEDSWIERTGSFRLNFRLFFSSPLIGVKLRDIIENPLLQNNTSSTTILLCMLGVFGGSTHILSWMLLVWEKRRNVCMNLLLALILSLSFNTENLITDVFLWLFPVMAMCQKGLPGRWGQKCIRN